LTDEELERARQVCTPVQVRALEGWSRGWTYHLIGFDGGGVRPDTARSRVETGLARLGPRTAPVDLVTARCGRCDWTASVPPGDASAAFAAHPCG
jgi:hypothetical protein